VYLPACGPKKPARICGLQKQPGQKRPAPAVDVAADPGDVVADPGDVVADPGDVVVDAKRHIRHSITRIFLKVVTFFIFIDVEQLIHYLEEVKLLS
jgi:hypothetical protein